MRVHVCKQSFTSPLALTVSTLVFIFTWRAHGWPYYLTACAAVFVMGRCGRRYHEEHQLLRDIVSVWKGDKP